VMLNVASGKIVGSALNRLGHKWRQTGDTLYVADYSSGSITVINTTR
jgi:hypothetical protein